MIFPQAIIAKFLGPTNNKGARVKAFCASGEVILPWDHELDLNQNYARAALALQEKLGWGNGLQPGILPDGSGVFCQIGGIKS